MLSPMKSSMVMMTLCAVLMMTSNANAFMTSPTAIPQASVRSLASASASSTNSPLHMMDTAMVDSIMLASSSATASSIVISETEPWVQPLANVLGPFLNIFSFAMLCRVVISWYPTTNLNELPYSIAVWPTEPLLKAIRGSIPPAFGVDITPIVWLGIFTFFNEILLGQQGLLTMKIKYGI